MEELSATAKVILGMIAFGRQTGYDIKQFVEKSTRNFWAASYGQIYPELKRLEEQGLIEGKPEPSGERARTVYGLTDAGRDRLTEWLASTDDLLYEVRDEGLLKLFFSDNLPERRLETVRAMRAVHERKLERLRAIEPFAKQGPTGPCMALEFGIEHCEYMLAWCDRVERRLTETNTEVTA
jgi:DNA-binding PadR family transcriptional regulator